MDLYRERLMALEAHCLKLIMFLLFTYISKLFIIDSALENVDL